MLDNLKAIETRVDLDIDPAGAPGSILAQNHNDILKDVLSKLGKYTGSPYLANKTLAVFPSGSMSWNSNAMDNTSNFTITVSKLTVDLNDFGEVLSRTKTGSLMKFKDYLGRSADLLFQSYVADVDGSANDIYIITVKGVAQNINYTYQDAEIEPCLFSFLSSSTNTGQEYLIDGYWVDKKSNLDVSAIEIGDQIRGNFSATNYIIADVIALPHTSKANLELYLDNEK